jgi:hypothetical protein
VVTIHPTWIALRLKKTKQVFQLDIASAFQHAALLKTNKDRAEKKAAKIAKKKGSSK